MDIEKAIKLAGGRPALASILGVTTHATRAWGKDLPREREWQLRGIRPEWFIEGSGELSVADLRVLEQSARIDRILQMAEEIRREVLAWRNS